MNMLLLEQEDFFAPGKARVGGRRFDRLRNFIRIEVGKELKAGVRNTGCGRAVVERIGAEEAEVTYTHLSPPPPPLPLTLIMALQRPQTFEKVLHGAVSLGVKKIHFIHTFKVEKSYWQSSRLLPENLREEITLATATGGVSGTATVAGSLPSQWTVATRSNSLVLKKLNGTMLIVR